MENSIKELYISTDQDTYSVFLCNCVANISRKLVDPDFDNSFENLRNHPGEICFEIFFAAKTQEDAARYYNIITSKIENEIGKDAYATNQLRIMPNKPILYYCLIASEIDYDAQDILQDDFSIKTKLQNPAKLFELARKAYCHHYTETIKNIKQVGIYDTVEELYENYFDDMIKANSLGFLKSKEESIKEDIGLEQYKVFVSKTVVYDKITNTKFTSEYRTCPIRFAAKSEKQAGVYRDIIVEKAESEFESNEERKANIHSDWSECFYSVAANSVDYDSQDILQPDYSIIEHIDNDLYKSNDNSNLSLMFYPGLYSDVLQKLLKIGLYKNIEEFQENYLNDMIKLNNLEKEVDECCCAGGIGGVTTASFAPAVTNTIYPRPGSKKKKKKKAKKEDSDETIADVYSYYGCVVRLSLSFPGSDTKVRKYYVVLGKDLGQIDEFNQKINQNLKQISNDSCILSTTLTSMLYSTEIKDFDFEGQKLLDSSLYVDDPKKFISSEEQLDQEEVQIRYFIGRSYDNLADFTNDLFSQMTEDTDDVYWPVRNDDTDAFEKMIIDARQAKKDKIIARKERTIAKRDKTLNDWLEKMAQDENYSTLALQDQALKYNAATCKIRAELARIKKLPLDSPEFF